MVPFLKQLDDQVVAKSNMFQKFEFHFQDFFQMANFHFRGHPIIFWRRHRRNSYTYDRFKKWSYDPEIENFPLMPLLIYNKIFISESSGALRTIQSTPKISQK